MTPPTTRLEREGPGGGEVALVRLLICLMLLFLAAPALASPQLLSYDLVVVGAGTGGSAAAIQAARSDLRVAVVERSDWIGGQMTAAAVSTLDDLGSTRTGIYEEFIGRARAHYARLGAATNICLWGADTIALEPRVGQDILREMMCETGKVDLFLRAEIETADARDGKLRSLSLRTIPDGFEYTLTAPVFIDATECGDLLPLTGAAYRLGNSVSPKVDPDANVQDITYVAVVRKYAGGLPDALRLPGPPPGYEEYAEGFRRIVAIYGNTWPGKYPFDVPSHNAYRALPDPANTYPIVGDESATWPYITKTCINWANDYPGEKGDEPGLSVRFIEDRAYRREIERDAMRRTLAFLWYMQTELGMSDWSVDDSQGYGRYFSNDWNEADDPRLPREFAPILRHFPPVPYVREGRRVVGVNTLKQSDIVRDRARGRALKNYPSGLALGEYPVDIHGSHLDRYMEHDLGESTETFPREWIQNPGVFQVPFEVFIPEKVDGLIAAEKNISVSRMVNGAIRLHPITMHTGQAAGAIAVAAVRGGVEPRGVKPLAVQRALMDGGQYLALDRYEDTKSDDCYWRGVQWASLYEALGGISQRQFGTTLPITRAELARVLAVAYPGRSFDLPFEGQDGMYLSRAQFLKVLDALGDRKPSDPRRFFACSDMDLTLKRGEAVALVFEALTGRE